MWVGDGHVEHVFDGRSCLCKQFIFSGKEQPLSFYPAPSQASPRHPLAVNIKCYITSHPTLMTRMLGIEFAPIHIPLERRLQTMGAIHHFFITLFLPLFTFLIPLYIVGVRFKNQRSAVHKPLPPGASLWSMDVVGLGISATRRLSLRLVAKPACSHVVCALFSCTAPRNRPTVT